MNHVSSHFILVTTPDHLRGASAHGLPLAHMAYRLGSGPHLFRTSLPAVPRGGLMMIGEDRFDGQGDAPIFWREVLRECQLKNFSGVILDPESTPTPTLARIISSLGEQLSRRGLSYFLPEAYCNYSNTARIMISTAISGGNLEQRLTQAVAKYGAQRITLCLDRAAEDFYLPAPQGAGRSLSRDELRHRIDSLSPSIFFSKELCANYFTYMSRESGAHFILFDDVSSIHKKISLGEQLGIRSFFLFHQEMDDILLEILAGKH